MRRSLHAVAIVAILLALLFVMPLAGCGTTGGARTSEAQSSPLYKPVFMAASSKVAETSGQDFTRELYREALAYEPLLDDPSTQVSMVNWSAAGNHGSLARVLDTIDKHQRRRVGEDRPGAREVRGRRLRAVYEHSFGPRCPRRDMDQAAGGR